MPPRPEILVCTFDTAVKLVAAGLWSDTYFVWVCDGQGETRVQPAGLYLADDERAIPAYTLAEVLAALPPSLDLDGIGYSLDLSAVSAMEGGEWRHDGWAAAYCREGWEATWDHHARNPAEAAARLWLALHGAGLLPSPPPPPQRAPHAEQP